MKDTIFIKNLRIEMAIGITSPERARRQPVVINVKMRADIKKAAKSDKVEDTIDYHAVAKDIEVLAHSRHFDLIESFVDEIATLCLKRKGVKSVYVSAEKPNIMSELCDSVGVEIERKK